MADDSTFGGGLTFPGGDNATAGPDSGADVPSRPAPLNLQAPDSEPTRHPSSFGGSLRSILPGPNYHAPDPAATALDQTADTLQQRIERANSVATNPVLQFFNPEGVQAARTFVPQATEMLQKIKQQKAQMQANVVQATTLGLSPGEVPDEASQADRVEVAKSKALKGDLRVFKGLQAVDPKAAEAIQDQVHEVVAGHLTKAQYGFDSLAGMQNQGQYEAKLKQLRDAGVLTDLEALGLKVPGSFDTFNANKAREGQALREARIGVDTVRQKLEERNTYQPMEKKEAETYTGRLTTAYGDQVTNGQWARNGAAGTRGLVVNGMDDPRNLRGPDGKGTYTLATPDQRKEISEAGKLAVSKEDIEKYRAFNRTYDLATKDAKGNPLPADKINTNPNVQQGVAEGLASMLRGGAGGANVGLLKIELAKRGWAQGAIDGLVSNYAGALNTLFDNANKKDYQSVNTQRQIREVMDVLKNYTGADISDRIGSLAERAGALGLDRTVFGLGNRESGGVIDEAMERGRQTQIERMMPNHQAIGGGDGVLQLGAQRPGVNAVQPPAGAAAATTQLPGAPPLTTPVQQATQTPGASPGLTTPPPAARAPQQGTPPAPQPGPAGGGGPSPAPAAPVTIAGQTVNVPPLPAGASPNFIPALQRIESGRERDPWRAGNDKSSASGMAQFTNATWKEDRPPGAPDRARDATPQQQTEALVTRAHKNAAALTKAGLPVDDTSLYVAHNLGATGGPRLLAADPDADARTVVGDAAAKNNPLFFKGKPTVATVLDRYRTEMEKAVEPASRVRANSDGPDIVLGRRGLMDRIRDTLIPRQPGESEEAALRRNSATTNATIQASGDLAVEHAPAIGSTIGALGGGAVGGPAGAVGGGAVGGGAGQSLKDYLQGRDQSPAAIAKEAALGGVLGVAPAGRPVLGAAMRAVGAGAVEGGAAAAGGGDASDVADAALHGTAMAAGSEAFGRALGMAGHKVFSMFAPDAQKTVRAAAEKFATAEETLAKEAPTLPSVGGVAGGKNPKYEAAEKARTDAETVLKDAGLKPEEAAYAHKVSSEGVPRQEAEAAKPGALEKDRIGAGYQQLEGEVGAAGVGAVRATPRQRTALPESDSLNLPRPPTSEELAKNGRIESVPLSEVRSTQSTMQWDRFNSGDHPPPVVKGFEDRPVAVRKENGEYLVFDGHHRIVKDMNAGRQTKDMYVIDAKSYDPANAGRKPAKSRIGDEELLTELGVPAQGPAKPRGGNSYNPVLTDGPMSAIVGKQVSAKHAELAERTEMAITAPAKNWQDKWVQLKDARSALLTAERDALTSTGAGRSREAQDMRVLADTVRTQQEKAAKHVFGEKDGEAFIGRLKVLDTRYRNLMEATNGGDLAKAAAMKGEAGRDADRKFRAFAHDDPAALAAWTAMRRTGANLEQGVHNLVAAERIPVLGKAYSAAKLLGSFNNWMRERAAGSPATFESILNASADSTARSVRDVTGTAVQRGAVM